MIQLNLISPERKHLLTYEYRYLYARTIAVIVLYFLCLISGLTITARYMLSHNLGDVLAATTLVNDKNRRLDREIQELNRQLKDIQYIQENYTKWSTILVGFNEIIPTGVQISYFNLEKQSRAFTLTGVAREREQFLILKNNLEKLSYLEELNSPLTNLLSRTNIQFQFTAKVKASALTTLP